MYSTSGVINLVINLIRFSQHTIVHRHKNRDRNVGMECLLYICSSVLFIFDRNVIILLNGCFFNYPLYTQQSIFYLQIIVDLFRQIYLQIIVDLFRQIFIYAISTHIIFFLSRSRFIYINENNFNDCTTSFIYVLRLRSLVIYLKNFDSIFLETVRI